MLGAIIGDIVGSRFEFNNHLSTDFDLFTPECDFTDDTICTIAVADALLKDIPFAESLRYWCRKYPHPKGSYGGSFFCWLSSENPQPYNSFGNGSAMRVSPCAWLSNDMETVLSTAMLSVACTHNHPEGVKGALCVAECIFRGRFFHGKHSIKQLVEDRYGYTLNATCTEIRKNKSFNETCQVTVPQAIICFLESDDFESAIRLAVSIGGDSDTIAAITGSIAEAYYSIPENIKTKALGYLPQDMLDVYSAFNNRLLAKE